MSVVELASRLIREDTAGGNESRAAAVVAPLLESAGFVLHATDLGSGRTTLVAVFGGGGALTLSGHFDTVLTSPSGWSRYPCDPFADGDRLFGRGSSDMKGGVAALVLAAARHVRRSPSARGLTVVLTAGEEEGCLGARALDRKLLSPDPILIVGESTSNAVRFGHRGATWLAVTARGVAAHASRPTLGRNAIDALVRGAVDVSAITPQDRHPQLGAVTSSIGTISGGTQVNVVPADAALTIDLRTVPGTDVDTFETEVIRRIVNGRGRRLLDLAPVWSDPSGVTALEVVDAVSSVTGERQGVDGTSFFTDAAVLGPRMSPRSFIVGPGDPTQPHAADETCSIFRLEQAVSVYEALLDRWERGLIR